MKTFNITETEQGNDFGNFQAEDERGALEALANDAGYKSYADMLYVTGGRGTLRVTEVESYNIVFSEGHSSDTRTYPHVGDLSSAKVEARKLLGGALIGEGWVRIDQQGGEYDIYSEKA